MPLGFHSLNIPATGGRPYELLVPGREDPIIAPTEVVARRLITYSESAPTAKEVEEQLLFKDMQLDLARQILRHVAAMKREL